MTTDSGSTPDLPAEEDVDPAQVDEQLETEPDEARNATDGYAPAEDDADPEIIEDPGQ
jgi:hypothetical protein